MTPKQQPLAHNIPTFIQKIDAAFSDYHVGIATSDVGTTRKPGQPWGGNLGRCDSFAGDDGQLQASPCTERHTGSSLAAAACATLCPDDRYGPIDGSRFIAKSGATTNVPRKLELDPMTGTMIDVGPIKAFQCLALVGDDGCGVDHYPDALAEIADTIVRSVSFPG